MVRRRGYELATMAGVEPARSTFVASSPKSLGPWPLFGCSPGCRAQPSPLIWQLSRAYKARPHTGADYTRMDVRVDLHHHRQVYETCAPLFVLRHRNGASRSARTFVSSSSG
jgi:hypothetical protein